MDVLQNRALQTWFIFSFFCSACHSISGNVTSMYLTNDLSFPKETLSMIRVVSTPLNILLAGLSGYMATGDPFPLVAKAKLLHMLCSSYCILVLLWTFPDKESISQWTTAHVLSVNLFSDLLSGFEYVAAFGILFSRTDKRISGIHATVLASMSNMSSYLHKFYIFKLIDLFGIFYPQIVIGLTTLIIWFVLSPRFIALQDLPKEAWHITDSVLRDENDDKSKKKKEV